MKDRVRVAICGAAPIRRSGVGWTCQNNDANVKACNWSISSLRAC
jgi:hypothetical protein